MGNEKWSGERGQFARERKSVFVTILAASIKKKKEKNPNPVFHETTSFAAAAKKKTPEQLNRLINGVYRDATKDERLQTTVWMKNSKQTK